MRTWLIAAALSLTVSTLAPLSARAEQPAQSAAPAVEGLQKNDDAPGCHGKTNGGACCASPACQANQASTDAAKAAAPSGGGCPCQRARQAAQAAESNQVR